MIKPNVLFQITRATTDEITPTTAAVSTQESESNPRDEIPSIESTATPYSSTMNTWSTVQYFSAPPYVKKFSTYTPIHHETKLTSTQYFTSTIRTNEELDIEPGDDADNIIEDTEHKNELVEFEWINFENSNIVQKSQPLKIDERSLFEENVVKLESSKNEESGFSKMTGLAVISSVSIPLLLLTGDYKIVTN